MMRIEKTIATREATIERLKSMRNDCIEKEDWWEEQWLGAAIVWLNKMEPVEPTDIYYTGSFYGKCGACGSPLFILGGAKSKFCSMCGKEVKWPNS